MRRMYAPHYPDIALQAGLALVARPRRVLALAAHPGDLELHAAGTLFLMAQAGSHITAAVLTPGASHGRQNAKEVHRREQEQAAAALGIGRLVALDLPYQGLTEHPRLGPALRRLWEESRPELVLAPDPQGLFFPAAPDEAAVGHAVAAAALGQVDPGSGPGPESTRPTDAATVGREALMVARDRNHLETQVLLYGTRRPNLLVDITEVLPEKVQAVKSFRSRLPGPDRLAAPLLRRFSRLYRSRTPAYYVEGFYRVL